MRELERSLKRVPLRAPSPDLDARVMGQKPTRPPRPSLLARPVPLWATAAISLVVASIGYGAGALRPESTARDGRARIGPIDATSQREGPPTFVEVRMICDSPDGNPFDFRRAESAPKSTAPAPNRLAPDA